jgi:NAD(P)-dependent dehydrogenase (short-subunit alcohol dehydrogenase family)
MGRWFGRRYLLFALVLAASFVPPVSPAQAEVAAPTVLITGSNRGIGLEFVRQYAADNWRVIATCRRPDAATELNALAAEHANIVVEQLDVNDHARVDALARQYADRPIDVLLNNAAYLGDIAPQTLGQIDYQLYTDILATNAVAPIKISEAFLPHVAASQQKTIVILGSAAGSNGLLSRGNALYAYRSSKAAVHIAAHRMAHDLADQGIRVALINPGVVDTRGILDLRPGDPVPEAFKPLLPLIESGQLNLIRPAESVAGMRNIIENLTAEQAGRFINYDGAEIPW